MGKNFLKIITGFMSAVVMSVSTLTALPISAFTTLNGYEYDPYIVAVTAINEEENDVYLTNGCAISQDVFHRYSGETFDLKYGDVIQVDCISFQEIIPGRFSWGPEEVPNIEYLGTAKDYYDTKELVVAEKNADSSKVTFKDSDGESYMWDMHRNTWNNPVIAERYGYKTEPEFDPKLIKIGDKFECAVGTDEDYVNEKQVERNVVIMPVSKVESADNSKTFSVSNLVYMQKYLTHSYEDSIKSFSNYDLNDDGSIDVFDVIILRRMILSKNFYIY